MIWFAQELETAATFWRVERRDGVTLGFTAHDRDLAFGGVIHRASPGMAPSAIRRSAGFEPDSAEVAGALSHDSIAAADLAEGRFDGARVLVGLVDWESLESEVIYAGTIGAVSGEAGRFTAELLSRKAELLVDPIPRTSPSCRAEFCGPGCMLSAAKFTHEAVLTAHDAEANTVTVVCAAAGELLESGTLRWVDGPHAGRAMGVLAGSGATLTLDTALAATLAPGLRATVIEGCDRTLDTCATRFGNAVNFQGEPFLPGNDMVARYPSPVQ
jgi:uncharacterized phage protein (TIGR02218 family)